MDDGGVQSPCLDHGGQGLKGSFLGRSLENGEFGVTEAGERVEGVEEFLPIVC